MNRQVWELCANGGDQHRRRTRLEQTSHVLDGENVNTMLDELRREIDVVIQRIFCLLRIAHVTAVAYSSFNNTTSVAYGIYTKHEIVGIVERIKHAENVDTRFFRLMHKRLHDVVGVRRVAHRVSPAKKHLKWNVRDFFAKKLEATPRVFVKESKSDVKGRSAPHFERVRTIERASRERSRTTQIVRANTSSEKRLVRVTPRGVHDEQTLVVAHRLGERRRALLVQNSLETRVLELIQGLLRLWHGGLDARRRWTNRTGVIGAVHGHITEVVEEFLRVIDVRVELEEARCAVDEISRKVCAQESLTLQDVHQEGNVRLHTANTELIKRAVHLLHGCFETLLLTREFDEKRVIVWRHARTDDYFTVEAHTHATRWAVHLNLTKVGRKVHGWIFSGDSALHGETLENDVVLRLDANVGQALPVGDENLRLHQVDTSHFFGDGVFNLDTRVNFQKVVTTLLVNHKLDGTGVAVVDVLGKRHGVVEKSLTKLRIEIRRRRELDNFLVTTLHGAITLTQVNDIAVGISEDLHFDVSRRLDVTLQKHTTVAKGSRRFA